MLRVFLSRALDLVLRRRRDDRLSEEIQMHLELLTEEHVAQGMTRDEARDAARRAFGGVDRVKTLHREQRGMPAIDSLIQDVRYGARLLRQDRRFTLAAIAALALGIGANTTAFTFVNAALLREMPLQEPDRLLAFTAKNATGVSVGASYADFKDWREATQAFSQLVVSMEVPMNVGDEGLPPERYWGSLISVEAFKMLGQTPTLGRNFTAEDDQPGSPAVIIAHSLWKGRYGSDPAIVGRTIRVNETPLTVIGVMPPTFHFVTVTELWRPISVALPATLNGKRNARGTSTWVVGRLADGVTTAQARSELATITERLAKEYPDTNASTQVSLVPLQEALLGGLTPMLLLVMAAVSIVLLIACVNVANLLMARAVHRSREMALRLSLGATRGRILRQLLVESLMLSALGSAVGFVLATYGARLFAATVDEMMSSNQNPADFYLRFTMDERAFVFTAAVCIVATLLFGLAPALQIAKTDANDILKDGGRTATLGSRSRRWTSALLTAQLALTLVLLACALFVARNFEALYRAAQVTDTSGIVTMRVSMAPRKYPTPDHIKRFYRQLEERLAALPAGTFVTVSSDIPFVPTLLLQRQLVIDGRPVEPGVTPPTVSYLYAGSHYFETFRLPMRQGRVLDERDGSSGQEGVVVNERFASLFFPDGSALGRRIQLVNTVAPDAASPWYTIVGISPTVSLTLATADQALPAVYGRVESEPTPNRFASITVRSSLDQASTVAQLRREMAGVDPDLPGYWIKSLDEALAQWRWMHRVFGLMLAVLASIALMLAAVGLYAVTAHGVAERAHEIGVRMALGANASQVVGMFVRRTARYIAVGLAIGLTAVVAAGHLLQTLLGAIGPVHVGARDPLTLTVVALLLVAVATLAAVVPARRAARLDPVNALREG